MANMNIDELFDPLKHDKLMQKFFTSADTEENNVVGDDMSDDESKKSKKKKDRKKLDIYVSKEELEKQLDEYLKLDYEDMIGDTPIRFKYASVTPSSFGLTSEEIFELEDAELNQRVAPSRLEAYVTEQDEKKFRKSFFAKKDKESRGGEDGEETRPTRGRGDFRGGRGRGSFTGERGGRGSFRGQSGERGGRGGFRGQSSERGRGGFSDRGKKRQREEGTQGERPAKRQKRE